MAGNRPPEFIGDKFILDPSAQILTVAQSDEALLVICKSTRIRCERRVRNHDAELNRMGREGSTEVAYNVRTI